MLCRLQCARYAIRWRIAGALPSSPRHSHGRRWRTPVQPSALTRSPRRSRGLTPCERLVSGSTPNKIASGLRTSRSEFSLNRLRKRAIALKHARTNANSLRASFGCRTRKRPRLSGSPQSTTAQPRLSGSPQSTTAQRGHFVGKRSNRAQAKGKPLFRAAFLQFSADCDVGAYLVVRNEPKKGR